MGDTGSMSLGITLGIIGMLTDSALILMIIGSVFVLEAVSTIIQILSKKLRKKKYFYQLQFTTILKQKAGLKPK